MDVKHRGEVPVYQQLVDRFVRDINGGRMPAGSRLPTVRELAEQLAISKGTVKHAYDTLQQMGLIEKTQGRGSFVSGEGGEGQASKKKQALAAIGHMLDVLDALEFSPQEARIFLDLCLREREAAAQNLRIGVVDCSPEALGVLSGQVAALPGVDVYDYLLEDVLAAKGPFDPPVDLVITTPTHQAELAERLVPGREVVQLVLAPSAGTVLRLSRVAPHARVGILCASRRFAGVIGQACALYCAATRPPKVQLLGDAAQTGAFLAQVDVLVLPPGYLRFCTAAEREMLQNRDGKDDIEYAYEIERGSLVYLRQEVDKLRQAQKRKI